MPSPGRSGAGGSVRHRPGTAPPAGRRTRSSLRLGYNHPGPVPDSRSRLVRPACLIRPEARPPAPQRDEIGEPGPVRGRAGLKGRRPSRKDRAERRRRQGWRRGSRRCQTVSVIRHCRRMTARAVQPPNTTRQRRGSPLARSAGHASAWFTGVPGPCRRCGHRSRSQRRGRIIPRRASLGRFARWRTRTTMAVTAPMETRTASLDRVRARVSPASLAAIASFGSPRPSTCGPCCRASASATGPSRSCCCRASASCTRPATRSIRWSARPSA